MTDDNARALRHERITILSGMVQSLRAEVARLQTDLSTARAALSRAEWDRDAERAERRHVEQDLAQLREVYNDLLRVVREREAGR